MKRKRKRNKSTWLIVFLVLGYFLYNFISTEFQLIRLRSQRDDLNEQIESELSISEQLAGELDQMNSDEYIESLARKYFGLVYPQEKIIIEIESDNNN